MRISTWFRKVLVVIVCLWSWASIRAQAQSFDRAIPCGSGQSYYSGPSRMVIDKAGNSYVLGYFNGTATFGTTILTASVAQSFVAKLDAAGNYLWAVQLGNYGPGLRSLAIDSLGDVYVAGSFYAYSVTFGTSGLTLYNSSALGEAFVAKLSGTTRQWLWARRAGGTGLDYISNVATNAAGEVYVTGTSYSSVADFGTITLNPMFPSTAFMAKLNSSGSWLWVRRVGDNRVEQQSLLVDAQGAIYLVGVFAGVVHFGAYTLTTQSLNSSSAGTDVFIAKTDDAGNWLWVTQGAPNGRNQIRSTYLADDGAGHLYLTGAYSHFSAQLGNTYLPNLSNIIVQNPSPPIGVVNYYSDVYVARLSATTGAWDWAVRTGGPMDEVAQAFAADKQGRVYVAGTLTAGTTSQQLAQLNGNTGQWLAVQPTATVLHFLTVDEQNRIWQGGEFTSSSATFGAFVLINAGNGQNTGYLARSTSGLLATRSVALSAAELRVWPNPTASRVVRIEGVLHGQTVEVFDLLGRKVGQGQMPAQGALQLVLPASLSAGTYVVKSAARSCSLLLE